MTRIGKEEVYTKFGGDTSWKCPHGRPRRRCQDTYKLCISIVFI